MNKIVHKLRFLLREIILTGWLIYIYLETVVLIGLLRKFNLKCNFHYKQILIKGYRLI